MSSTNQTDWKTSCSQSKQTLGLRSLFRDGANPSVLWAVNDAPSAVDGTPGANAISATGDEVPFGAVTADPSFTTFGAVNPSFVPEPGTTVLCLMGAVSAARIRRRRLPG